MAIFSSLILAVASLLAALLLFRQPVKLSHSSKVLASVVSLCAVFICIASISPLLVNTNSNDGKTFALMIENLRQYLAVPLFGSAFLSLTINRNFSRASWGRWSLALLATFELCRRTQAGEYYGISLGVLTSLIIGFCIFYQADKNIKPAQWLLNVSAVSCFVLAMLIFNKEALISLNIMPATIIQPLTDISFSWYNFFLAYSLLVLCSLFSEKLANIRKIKQPI
ncbi:MAG: hypothetical protein ACI9ES_000617 [Oceanospirillaceae bacterium]|jgi:hypothetical protein